MEVMNNMAKRLDALVEDQGSIILLRLLTKAARRWVSTNVGDDATYWCGALVIEPRYAQDVLLGMGNDGLTVRA